MAVRISQTELYSAVWFFHVHSKNLVNGWLNDQGEGELKDSIATMRKATAQGRKIPTLQEAFEYYNRAYDDIPVIENENGNGNKETGEK